MRLCGCVFAWIKDTQEWPLRILVLYTAHSCPHLLPCLKWPCTRKSLSLGVTCSVFQLVVGSGKVIIWPAAVASKGGFGVCREVALLGREEPLADPAIPLEAGEARRLALQVSPHPLPIAKTAQPGLGLFSSCSDKTQLCLCCWEALRWLWINSFCLSSCRLQALMSRQWYHGHQTAFGDELRVCFGLPYSKCANWVKYCSGNLFNQSWDFWVEPGYFGHLSLIFGVCFVQVEYDIF